MKIGIFGHMDCAHCVKAFCDGTHGHTYKVEVVVEGEPRDGLVQDFGILFAAARRVMAKYDHKNLNDLFEVPSCENLSVALFEDLRKELPGLCAVRCWEGFNKWAETEAGDVP